MKIDIIIKEGKFVSKDFIKIFDKAKQKEFGAGPIKDFSKYHKDIFFILKINKKVVSFGQLRPREINYLGKKYNILGLSNIISLKKGKGYGKILMKHLLNYLKQKKKVGIGFCERKNDGFYKKCDLIVKKNLSKRFYFKPKNKAEKDYLKYFWKKDCDIIYFDKNRKIMPKILSTKSKVLIKMVW